MKRTREKNEKQMERWQVYSVRDWSTLQLKGRYSPGELKRTVTIKSTGKHTRWRWARLVLRRRKPEWLFQQRDRLYSKDPH